MKNKPNESFRIRNEYLAKKADKRYTTKKRVLILGGVLAGVIAVIVATVVMSQYIRYNRANELYTAGQYDNAIPRYEELGDYLDSRWKLSDCYVHEAQKKRTACDWEGALADYTKAAEINDSLAYNIPNLYMTEGRAKREQGDWNGAVEAFMTAGDYQNAAEQVKETRYLQAQALTDTGDVAGAVEILRLITGYKDADELLDGMVNNTVE